MQVNHELIKIDQKESIRCHILNVLKFHGCTEIQKLSIG